MKTASRRFSANYVFTNTGKPLRNGIVGVDDDGVVVEIIDHNEGVREYSRTLFHNGVIVPGFVNSPILSELKSLLNKLPQGDEMSTFLSAIGKLPSSNEASSGWESLSTFNQIKLLLEHFPLLTFAEVLVWATIDAAKALGVDNELGSIELGKKPGLNLIAPFNFEDMRPRNSSKLRPLI